MADDEIVPTATYRKVTLEEQAEFVRRLATRCTLSKGTCSEETVVFLSASDGDALTMVALTLESLLPVKDAVRRVVWNEQQKGRRR